MIKGLIERNTVAQTPKILPAFYGIPSVFVVSSRTRGNGSYPEPDETAEALRSSSPRAMLINKI
jgi:hypothetical protein